MKYLFELKLLLVLLVCLFLSAEVNGAKSSHRQTAILIVPMFGSGEIALINEQRKVLHKWTVEPNTFSGKLINNQLVYNFALDRTDVFSQGLIGQAGGMRFIDGKSNVLKGFEDPYMHHGFDVMPNGNPLVIKWVPFKGKTPKKWPKGKAPPDRVWTDVIQERNATDGFKVLRQWNLVDYITPKEIQSVHQDPFVSSIDLLHANSVYYYSKNPINGKPCLVVTMRNSSHVLMIDYEAKKLIWKSPKGVLLYPHDGRLLKNGNILVYSNGLSPFDTKVVELNTKTNKVIWSYGDQLQMLKKWQFHSFQLSGAQKLDNGNVFITSGIHGHLFEVTPDKKVVLEIPSAASFLTDVLGGPAISIFRAEKYRVDLKKIKK